MASLERYCPVCSSAGIEFFFEMNGLPVFCNVLHTSREDALNAPRGDMKLGFCRACGHIYNYAFDPALMNYTQSYENSLHFSPVFQRYAEELAANLIQRYNLRNKSIVEIGCGKGDFLKLLCDEGENEGTGFDASYQPELLQRRERLRVIQDSYSAKYAHLATDFVVCRHVLEHIASPREFVENIRGALGSQPALYFEVPNALWTLRDLGVWDLIYEHCSYFTPHSLVRLFTEAGFGVLNIAERYNGQFLGIELTPGVSAVTQGASVEGDSLAKLVLAFAENYRSRVESWQKRFAQIGWEGKRIVVWGGGSKGVTFLNVMRAGIEFMIDINPRKQGMYVAGTGQQIVSPEFLRTYAPDLVIVMNPIYMDEIRTMLPTHSEIAVA